MSTTKQFQIHHYNISIQLIFRSPLLDYPLHLCVDKPWYWCLEELCNTKHTPIKALWWNSFSFWWLFLCLILCKIAIFEVLKLVFPQHPHLLIKYLTTHLDIAFAILQENVVCIGIVWIKFLVALFNTATDDWIPWIQLLILILS